MKEDDGRILFWNGMGAQCGVKIHGVNPKDAGNWQCRMKVKTADGIVGWTRRNNTLRLERLRIKRNYDIYVFSPEGSAEDTTSAAGDSCNDPPGVVGRCKASIPRWTHYRIIINEC